MKAFKLIVRSAIDSILSVFGTENIYCMEEQKDLEAIVFLVNPYFA